MDFSPAALETGADHLFDRLYSNPRRYGFACEDDAADALCRYWSNFMTGTVPAPGIPDPSGEAGHKAPERNMYWIARSVCRARRHREVRIDMASIHLGWEARERQDEWLNPAPHDTAGIPEKEIPGAADAFVASIPAACILGQLDTRSRRILFLFLSCAPEAGEAETRMVARGLGIPLAWLDARAHEARNQVLAETERRRHETELLASFWQSIRFFETQGQDESDPLRQAMRAQALARARSRYQALRNRLVRKRILVPHSAIARILGVPKGSVDSGIYYLRAAETGARGNGLRCGSPTE